MKKMFTVLLVMSLTLTCACAASAQVDSGCCWTENDGADERRFDFNVPFYHRVVNRTCKRRSYIVEPGNFGMALLNVNSDELDFRTQRSYEVYFNLCGDYFRLSAPCRSTMVLECPGRITR